MNWAREHPRLATYGAILAVAALYTARAILRGGTGVGWLAVVVAAIGILRVAEAHRIREAVNYHPAHKLGKHVAGSVFFLGAVGVWWGVDLLALAWSGALAILAIELVSFEFILFKNTGFGDFLRTIFGLVPVPTRAEALMHAEYTAALWRHELIPVAGQQAIEEAQRIPPKSEWLAHVREQLARRRAEAAENDRLATAVEVDSLLEEGPR